MKSRTGNGGSARVSCEGPGDRQTPAPALPSNGGVNMKWKGKVRKLMQNRICRAPKQRRKKIGTRRDLMNTWWNDSNTRRHTYINVYTFSAASELYKITRAGPCPPLHNLSKIIDSFFEYRCLMFNSCSETTLYIAPVGYIAKTVCISFLPHFVTRRCWSKTSLSFTPVCNDVKCLL